MVFLSIILCVLNIQAQSHFKLYKSEGHFYLNGEMNEIHVNSILLEAECRLDLAVGELQRNPRIQRHSLEIASVEDANYNNHPPCDTLSVMVGVCNTPLQGTIANFIVQ